MRRTRRLALAAGIAVIAGASLTGCSDDRWCEHDMTDVRVADRYCEQNTPGYEWESGSSHHKSHKSHKSKPSKSYKSKSGSSHSGSSSSRSGSSSSHSGSSSSSRSSSRH
jgi:uncharacterized membrane protein YgcG